MNKNGKNVLGTIIKLLASGMVFISAIVIVCLLNGTAMKLFGFEYENIYTLVLFFATAIVFFIPFEICIEYICDIINRKYSVKLISNSIRLILNLIIKFIVLNKVDLIMLGINGTTTSYLVATIIMNDNVIIDFFIKDDKEENKEEKKEK